MAHRRARRQFDCRSSLCSHARPTLRSALKLPAPMPHYQVESLERFRTICSAGGESTGMFLVVELTRPITIAMAATLQLHLREGVRGMTAGPASWRTPMFEPMDAARRRGTVSVAVDPIFQAQLENSSVPPSAWDEGPGGRPWRTAELPFCLSRPAFESRHSSCP